MKRQDHGRAELAEGAQPGEQQTGAQTAARDRHGDAQEARELATPEAGGEVEQRRVDRGEARASDDHEERRRDERLREHDASQRVGQRATEERAERRVGPDDVDQQDAAHQRR